jgi:ABC-type Fe3+ transport system substrate-binding protein
MLGNCAKHLQEKNGMEVTIEVQAHRPEEESSFKLCVEKKDLPDLTIGHVNDFVELPDGYLAEYFASLPAHYPLRKELADNGFADMRGYFHPFVIIPFAVFYNHNILAPEDIPKVWEDLLNPRWRNSILMPDEYRVVSLIIRNFMSSYFPDRFSEFQDNVKYQGSPIEVVNAVDEGKYSLGITNIAWARFSRQKNTSLIWPQDGTFCMPQVMVWKKGADKRLFEMGDYIMSKPVQEFLALQGFVPASPEVPLPSLLNNNNFSLRWQGWEHFIDIIKTKTV